jgi:DNA primase small subunit
LESAKIELIKLLDVLERDFGLSTGEIRVGFSGHRGYHLHVENSEVRTLDSMARKEIVDYLIGIGLEPSLHGLGLGEKNSRLASMPHLDDFGWRGRIAKETYKSLNSATQENLEKIGLKKKDIISIVENKKKMLENWKERSESCVITKYATRAVWQKIFQHSIERQSIKIDTVVTTDIHRLIRMTDTLHGKTGLKKVEVPINNIESFDPLKDAIAFKEGAIEINVTEAPEFRLGEETYGPFNRDRVTLPAAAAMLLLCKGLAGVTN